MSIDNKYCFEVLESDICEEDYTLINNYDVLKDVIIEDKLTYGSIVGSYLFHKYHSYLTTKDNTNVADYTLKPAVISLESSPPPNITAKAYQLCFKENINKLDNDLIHKFSINNA